MPFDKKFWISFVVVFIVAMVIGFINHGVLLAIDYEALDTGVMRSLEEQEAKFVWQIIAHVMVAFGFVWLYREGRTEGKAWAGQGVRFGVAFAVAATIPIFLIYHAVANFPLELAIKQSVFDGIGVVLLGLVAAFFNR